MEESCQREARSEGDQNAVLLSYESRGLSDVPFEMIYRDIEIKDSKKQEQDIQSPICSHNSCLTKDRGSLHCVDLKRNRITELGVKMYEFTSLLTLDISRNRLCSIARGISALVHLEQLFLLGNKLKMSSIPVDELVSMKQLSIIDLRYNEKLEKLEASKLLLSLFSGRVRISPKSQKPETPNIVKESACDRDSDVLKDQLAPWSTPQLRARLENVFGEPTDPAQVGRDEVMSKLLSAYEQDGPRVIVEAHGIPVDRGIVEDLTRCLQQLSWPKTTRERPKVKATKYFTLQRPDVKYTVQDGAKARVNAAKLEKYADIWKLLNKAISSVDEEYANSYTGVAITYGFMDSPHIDTENIGPFYSISLGDFQGGGKIAVESGPKEVTHVDTFQKMGKVDGRFPHWVTKYNGDRYSLVFYRTVGEASPMSRAVLC